MTYYDEMFGDFAEAFLGNLEGEGDVPIREALDVSALDYSLESLKSVDSYLKKLHEMHLDTSGKEYQNVVVWGGAYLGEVIRRNAQLNYHWMEYEDYMAKVDSTIRKSIPLILTTHMLLVAVTNLYMTMPMNKVARWIEEGEANNLHYYASLDITRNN